MSNRRVVKETPQYNKVLHEKAVSQASTRPGTRLLILFVFQVTVHTCPLLFGARKGKEQQTARSQTLAGLRWRTLPLLLAALCTPPAELWLAHRPFRAHFDKPESQNEQHNKENTEDVEIA